MAEYTDENSLHASECLRRLLGAERDEIRLAVEARATTVELKSGGVLFEQDDSAESMYIVVRGRLRVTVRRPDGSEHVVNEITRDQSVGEIAMFTTEPRSASVVAIRDSMLLRLMRVDFERIATLFPAFSLEVSRQVIERFSRAIRGGPARISPAINITLVQRTAGTDMEGFAVRLCRALGDIGSVLHLRHDELDDSKQQHLSWWLDEQEERHDFIVLQGDANRSAWTDNAIQHADKILLVGEAHETGTAELSQNHQLENGNTNVAFLFLHGDGDSLPARTAIQLPDKVSHHHIRQAKAADFARLARILGGRSTGLVLAGGGARALAHIGVYRALREAGIHIDLVGGTSMGAVVGALIAMDLETTDIARRCREVLIDSKLFGDYTVPLVALLNGKRLDNACQTTFQAERIEDLWLGFFCVSGNLATDETMVHDSGLLWRAIRSSVSLPGLVPPVIEGDKLLVDGGVVNNLPVDVMIQRGAAKVLAVDIRSGRRRFEIESESFPGTASLIKQRYLSRSGGSDAGSTPNIVEIIHASVLMSSVQNNVRNRHVADVYLSPPIDRFGFVDFERIDEIIQVGYEYAAEQIDDIRQALDTD